MENTSTYMQPSTYSSLDHNVHGVFTVKPEVHMLNVDLDASRDPGLLGCIGRGIHACELVLGWIVVVVKASSGAEMPDVEAEGVLLKEDKVVECLQEAGLGIGKEVNSLGLMHAGFGSAPSVYDSLGLLLLDKELLTYPAAMVLRKRDERERLVMWVCCAFYNPSSLVGHARTHLPEHHVKHQWMQYQ
jgi:hypothetical protein